MSEYYGTPASESSPAAQTSNSSAAPHKHHPVHTTTHIASKANKDESAAATPQTKESPKNNSNKEAKAPKDTKGGGNPNDLSILSVFAPVGDYPASDKPNGSKGNSRSNKASHKK